MEGLFSKGVRGVKICQPSCGFSKGAKRKSVGFKDSGLPLYNCGGFCNRTLKP